MRKLLQPIRETAQIWVVKRHQRKICALVSETLFRGDVAKCRLFSDKFFPYARRQASGASSPILRPKGGRLLVVADKCQDKWINLYLPFNTLSCLKRGMPISIDRLFPVYSVIVSFCPLYHSLAKVAGINTSSNHFHKWGLSLIYKRGWVY